MQSGTSSMTANSQTSNFNNTNQQTPPTLTNANAQDDDGRDATNDEHDVNDNVQSMPTDGITLAVSPSNVPRNNTRVRLALITDSQVVQTQVLRMLPNATHVEQC